MGYIAVKSEDRDDVEFVLPPRDENVYLAHCRVCDHSEVLTPPQDDPAIEDLVAAWDASGHVHA
jgi:hypothetical protein